jgi:hypothetical protein
MGVRLDIFTQKIRSSCADEVKQQKIQHWLSRQFVPISSKSAKSNPGTTTQATSAYPASPGIGVALCQWLDGTTAWNV